MAGCSHKDTTASSTTPAASANTFKVALLTTGPVNDGGWNEAAYNGLLSIQSKLGAQISKQENVKDADFEEAFRDYANQGYSLIIGHGDEFSQAAAKVAANFPKTSFVTVGGTNIAPNLSYIYFATEEGTYLQGMEAGYVTKSGKGGFIGGQEFPPVKAAAQAFANGAVSTHPGFTFRTTYLNSWVDPVAAKGQTQALLNSGCDVIAHNCDAAAKGMFDTAGTVPGVYTFGVNADENGKAPNVLSSAFLNIPKAFTDIAATVKNHTFKGSKVMLGLKQHDIVLIDNPKLSKVLTEGQKQNIKAAALKIADGQLKVL